MTRAMMAIREAIVTNILNNDVNNYRYGYGCWLIENERQKPKIVLYIHDSDKQSNFAQTKEMKDE
jgi:hypothetical protein